MIVFFLRYPIFKQGRRGHVDMISLSFWLVPSRFPGFVVVAQEVSPCLI